MSAYLVRLSQSHEVVGIFCANSLEGLADVVDEVTDPACTEYVRLGSGGFAVFEKTKAQWPMRYVIGDDQVTDYDEPNSEDEDPLKGGRFSEQWASVAQEGRWKPLLAPCAVVRIVAGTP